MLKSDGKVVPWQLLSPLKSMSSTQERNSRRESCSISWLRGDGEHLSTCQNLLLLLVVIITTMIREFKFYEDEETACKALSIEDVVNATRKVLDQQPAYNWLLTTEIVMQLQDRKTSVGHIRQRAVGSDGWSLEHMMTIPPWTLWSMKSSLMMDKSKNVLQTQLQKPWLPNVMLKDIPSLCSKLLLTAKEIQMLLIWRQMDRFTTAEE